jgi:membrane-bound lytic murein transglycosylase D
MAVLRKPAAALLRPIALLCFAYPLFSQQFGLHIALLPKAISDMEADTSTESYLDVVKKRPAPFQPNASDLIIGKAEEKFENGKRAYQLNDPETSRREFDSAVDLMLMASDNPSDRRLYESKLEEMVEAIHRFDLAGLGAGAYPQQAQFEKAPLDDIIEMTFPADPKIKGKVSEEVKVTASELPLTVNETVLGYINYFSGKGRRTIVAGLERAARYRPMISRILAEEGVPQELIHLAQAESGFLPRAVSYRAAVGMWQFVQFRGNEYGLHQTPYTDDRLDPEKATRAAARHLHDLYKHFGDWYLAIAAYNCGPNNVDKAVERTGYADYWELRARHALPVETSNYVPIILAMTIMTKNAAEYGLTDLNPDPVLEYDTVKVTSPTHLALVGDLTDTPVSQLIAMNPALIKNVAPADYDLRVPSGSADQLRADLKLFPEDRRAAWRMHRVETGETLASIARQYQLSPAAIESANRIGSDGPRSGDRLIIPASYHEAAQAHASKRPVAHRSLIQHVSIRSSLSKAHAGVNLTTKRIVPKARLHSQAAGRVAPSSIRHGA